ncbi:MAG: P-loop containing nucleoside triphosphate hydrolase protein [Piptocephalis tieghemiana]|nr:MAG: P-loop containing nucleoside triphosphate hydrolase protein [Piptocephalis tieghemiana]
MIHLVGISGPSSSGKSTIARYLAKVLPNAHIVHQDDFYKPQKEIPVDPSTGLENWDCPDAVNFAKFEQTIQALRMGKMDDVPEYLKTELPPTMEHLSPEVLEDLIGQIQGRVDKGDIFILVDGFLLFHDTRVRDIFPHRIYVYADKSILRERRKSREGYAGTDGGFWKDPPGYFDRLVWPAFLHWNSHLLEAIQTGQGQCIQGMLTLDSGKESLKDMTSHALNYLLDRI